MASAMQLYRLTDETVALAATVSALPSGVVFVAANGASLGQRFTVSQFASRAGRPLLVALGPMPTVGETVALTEADGAVLAQAIVPEPDGMPWLDIDAVSEVLEGPRDQLRFIRRFLEVGSFTLKLAQVARFRDLRDRAIARAVELSTPCRVERAIRLDRGIVLWVLQGVPVAAIQAVQLHRDHDVRPSPFQPIKLGQTGDGVPRSVLLTDGWDDGRGIDRILMWGRDALWSPEVRGQFIDTRSAILPFAQALGEAASGLLAHLAACLGPYLPSRPAISSVLKELSAMCPPSPPRGLTSDRPIGAGVDLSLVTDDGQLFASGWVFDPLKLIARVSWCHPSGSRIPISTDWVETAGASAPERYRDGGGLGAARGFAVALPGAAAGRWLPQQRFAVELQSGATFELVAPAAPQGPAVARDSVLSVVPDGSFTEDLVERAVGPVVAALQREHLAGDRIHREIVVGETPSRPAVSVVIPIYKVLEFLRYQIAAFAFDSDFADAELLFVVDSPSQADEVEGRLRALHGLYGVPARVIVHHRNLGYAPAVNTGVARSSGKTLVLMNSDVVPTERGWIMALKKRLTDGAGAVGPKLLFHDDSIQHAGMVFGRDLRGEYFNCHEFKGYPRGYPGANVPRSVDALTGACLMVSREIYEASGGLCEDYVIGDFEDSDLSFRIKSTGRTLWYEPAAELYHYERQSIVQNASYANTRACGYNRWLHTQRWGSQLESLVRKAPSAFVEPGPDQPRSGSTVQFGRTAAGG